MCLELSYLNSTRNCRDCTSDNCFLRIIFKILHCLLGGKFSKKKNMWGSWRISLNMYIWSRAFVCSSDYSLDCPLDLLFDAWLCFDPSLLCCFLLVFGLYIGIVNTAFRHLDLNPLKDNFWELMLNSNSMFPPPLRHQCTLLNSGGRHESQSASN